MNGINFSVDLKENENLNYEAGMKEIENTIKTWTNQILFPIGKIVVIKIYNIKMKQFIPIHSWSK